MALHRRLRAQLLLLSALTYCTRCIRTAGADAAPVQKEIHRLFSKLLASNVSNVVAGVHRAFAAGRRRELLHMGPDNLRAYCRAHGLSAKGTQPDLAIRVWKHANDAQRVWPRPKVSACSSALVHAIGGTAARSSRHTRHWAPPLLLRHSHTENVLGSTNRPPAATRERGGMRLLGSFDLSSGCEDACARSVDCDAATWFGHNAPEPWSMRCMSQNMREAQWEPSWSQHAVTFVKAYVLMDARWSTSHAGEEDVETSPASVLPQWVHAAASTADVQPCAPVMEIHPQSLDMTLLAAALVPTGFFEKPGACHQACLRSEACRRSVWMAPSGSGRVENHARQSEPLQHACFHLSDDGYAVLGASRKASFASKRDDVEVHRYDPLAGLTHVLRLPIRDAATIERAVLRASSSRLVMAMLRKEHLSLARSYLCRLGGLGAAARYPILWLCVDDASCALLREFKQVHTLAPETTSAASPGGHVARLMRAALRAMLRGCDVLLISPAQLWLTDPWPRLEGPFDVVGAAEQRLGDGYGFPLGADFFLLRRSNASANLVTRLVAQAVRAPIDESGLQINTLGNLLNDMLFWGLASNGTVLPGRLGAQLRRPEWGHLRVKVLDPEEFPPADVSLGWWRDARRGAPLPGAIVLRAAQGLPSAGAHQSLRAAAGPGFNATEKCAHIDNAAGAEIATHVAAASSSKAGAPRGFRMVSVVLLSHNHANNIPKLCRSLLPCRQAVANRKVAITGANRSVSMQIVVMEDGSTDSSLEVWRRELAHDGEQGVPWRSTNGALAGTAFPADGSLADLLFVAPNQHEIRSYHQGFAMAWGDVLVTLQDDETFVLDDSSASQRWVGHALRLLELHPDLAMISCNAGFLRQEGFFCDDFDPKYSEHCCYKSIAGCWGDTIQPVPMHDPRLPGVPFMFVAGINFGPHVVRRDAYFEIGGFDASWSEVGEGGIGYDIEYSLRAQERGHLVGVMECDGINRRVGGGATLSNSHSKTMRFLLERQNNHRLDRHFFNNKALMRGLAGRAMQANRKRLAGSLPSGF